MSEVLSFKEGTAQDKMKNSALDQEDLFVTWVIWGLTNVQQRPSVHQLWAALWRASFTQLESPEAIFTTHWGRLHSHQMQIRRSKLAELEGTPKDKSCVLFMNVRLIKSCVHVDTYLFCSECAALNQYSPQSLSGVEGAALTGSSLKKLFVGALIVRVISMFSDSEYSLCILGSFAAWS